MHAVDAGHAHVGNHHRVRAVGLDHFQRGHAPGGNFHGKFLAQYPLQPGQQVDFVVDQKNLFIHAQCGQVAHRAEKSVHISHQSAGGMLREI